MRYSFTAAALLGVAAADVTGITFHSFPAKGSYQVPADLTTCAMGASQPYSGSAVAPLDEELSVILRGPLNLKNFAVYNMAPAAKAKRTSAAERRHAHAAFHEKHRVAREAEAEAEAEAARGDTVVAQIFGKPVTMIDTWSPVTTPAAAVPAAGGKFVQNTTPTIQELNIKAPAGDWAKVASFDAANANSSGIAFLGNRDTGGSRWGPLNYVAANGQGYSATPQTMNDVLIPDNVEVVLATDKACGATDCGSTNPIAKAHHGWAGVNKMFIFEYSMPASGRRDFSADSINPDKPGIWMLNSKIPNTEQYGCSCWATGCGEMDVHEVLDPGATVGYAAMHMGNNYAGTPPQGIARPLTGTMKLAVIITDTVAHVQVLPQGQTFPDVIPASTVASFLGAGPSVPGKMNILGQATEAFAVVPHPFGK